MHGEVVYAVERPWPNEMSGNRDCRTVERRIVQLWNARGNADDIGSFAETVLRDLRLPAAEQKKILEDVKRIQTRIAAEWKTSFADVLPSKIASDPFARLQAAYSVDFARIMDQNVRETVLDEIRRADRAEYGFSTLRTRLKQRGLGEPQIKTLANTAVSQFSNAYMFQLAQEAGITRYKYDGPLNPNTRAFCRERVGKTYTFDEILAMDNGQGLDVWTSLGGYNCVHYWTPVLGDVPDPGKPGVRGKPVEGLAMFAGFEQFAHGMAPQTEALYARGFGEFTTFKNGGIFGVHRTNWVGTPCL